jgi:prephenate dehydrogenase
MNFSKVAILGPGLLGSSIALALRRLENPDLQIALWARRTEAVAEAQSKKIADIVSAHLEPVMHDADLVIFCVPIGSMAMLAEKIAPLISRETLVTDVGSVKSSVVASLGPIFQNRARFIGSHPMAGSEQTGLSAARADLFQNAMCMITPDDAAEENAVVELRDFWEALGCRVRVLSPREHDEIVALVSHLPHLLAATLVNTAHGAKPESLGFCGNGFRDTTRIASGPPAMWTEIFEQNREPLQNSVNAMIEKLRDVATLLNSGDSRAVEAFLAAAKTERDCLKTQFQ